MGFLDFLFLTANLPVLVCVSIVVAFLSLELISLLVGMSLHGILDDLVDIPDADVDADHDFGASAGALSLLGLGKVPFLIWLICLLTFVAITALLFNYIVWSVGFTPLLLLALLVSIPVALFANGIASGVISRLIPQETSTAVRLDSLINQRGQITVGTATREHAAECKVYDRHGQAHAVFVKPFDDTEIPHMSNVILVDRQPDGIFTAVKVDG